MSNQSNSKTKVYVHLFCLDCEEVWDITFENKTAHPGEYAIAIENKIGDGCPDCHGELKLVEPLTKKEQV